MPWPRSSSRGGTLLGDEESQQQLVGSVPIKLLVGKVGEAVLSLVLNPFITVRTVSVDGGMYQR
jgi:hypothetical protein